MHVNVPMIRLTLVKLRGGGILPEVSFPSKKRIIYAGQCHLWQFRFLFFREAEERCGTAAGNEGLLREERDRAG